MLLKTTSSVLHVNPQEFAHVVSCLSVLLTSAIPLSSVRHQGSILLKLTDLFKNKCFYPLSLSPDTPRTVEGDSNSEPSPDDVEVHFLLNQNRIDN